MWAADEDGKSFLQQATQIALGQFEISLALADFLAKPELDPVHAGRTWEVVGAESWLQRKVFECQGLVQYWSICWPLLGTSLGAPKVGDCRSL
jgi:hypothetical protein